MLSVYSSNGPQSALMHNSSANWNPSYSLSTSTAPPNQPSSIVSTDPSTMLGHQQTAHPTSLATSHSYPSNGYSTTEYPYAMTKTESSYDVPRRSASQDVYNAVSNSTRDPLFNPSTSINTTTAADTTTAAAALSTSWPTSSSTTVTASPVPTGLPSLPPLSEALHQIMASQQNAMTDQPQQQQTSSSQQSSSIITANSLHPSRSAYYAPLGYNDVAAPAYVTADGLMLGGIAGSDASTAAPILGPTMVVPGMLPPHLAVVPPALALNHTKYLPLTMSGHHRPDDDDDDASSSSLEHHHPPQKVFSFVSLPGINTKKRPRRRFEEIERHYGCNWPGCTKSYGTLNHLNAHVQMQKHGPKRHPSEFKELRKQWRRQKREEEERRAAEVVRKERDTQEPISSEQDDERAEGATR